MSKVIFGPIFKNAERKFKRTVTQNANNDVQFIRIDEQLYHKSNKKKKTKPNVYSVNTYTYLPRITHESSKAYFQWGPV
jgi:hypothetical protein